MILAVDLAAKYSAACSMNGSGNVTAEWCSWGLSDEDWIESIAWGCQAEDVLLVEDIPFNVGQTKTVRDVYRLQGRIIHEMARANTTDKLVWIPPALWQYHFKEKGMVKGDKKGAKSTALEAYGYSPPELLHKDLHGIDRVHARKSMEDHIDAFLIARYMLDQVQKYGSVSAAIDAIPRLERYAS